MSKLVEIVFDTETTGFDPATGDRVVEIGAVRIYDKLRTDNPEDTFHFLINPERDIPEEVVKVHGITNEKVKNAPKFHEIADKFLEFIGDAPLVAHNASFDMRFINAELALMGKPELQNEVVDTLQIARRKFPGSRATLDALCTRFEVSLESRTFHGALLDSQLLADVYLNLSGGLQRGLSLSGDTKEEAQLAVNLAELAGEKRTARTFPVDEAEFETHAAFVEKINAHLWLDTPPSE